jgi:hypothetical protein
MRLAPEIMLGGRDMLLVIAVRFLVIIVITAGGNCDPLGMPLLPLLLHLAPWCLCRWIWAVPPPPAVARDRCPITIKKDGPDRLFARSVPGGDIK